MNPVPLNGDPEVDDAHEQSALNTNRESTYDINDGQPVINGPNLAVRQDLAPTLHDDQPIFGFLTIHDIAAILVAVLFRCIDQLNNLLWLQDWYTYNYFVLAGIIFCIITPVILIKIRQVYGVYHWNNVNKALIILVFIVHVLISLFRVD